MELMSGNEAIARGAWEAGATIGVAYPGTPSLPVTRACTPNGARTRKSRSRLASAHLLPERVFLPQ